MKFMASDHLMSGSKSQPIISLRTEYRRKRSGDKSASVIWIHPLQTRNGICVSRISRVCQGNNQILPGYQLVYWVRCSATHSSEAKLKHSSLFVKWTFEAVRFFYTGTCLFLWRRPLGQSRSVSVFCTNFLIQYCHEEIRWSVYNRWQMMKDRPTALIWQEIADKGRHI